jgi:hypothetical protein
LAATSLSSVSGCRNNTGPRCAQRHLLSPLRSDVSLPRGSTLGWGRWSAEWGLSASQLRSPRLPLGSACSPSPSRWKPGANGCLTSKNFAAPGQAEEHLPQRAVHAKAAPHISGPPPAAWHDEERPSNNDSIPARAIQSWPANCSGLCSLEVRNRSTRDLSTVTLSKWVGYNPAGDMLR